MNGILKAAHVEKQAVNAAELALINKQALRELAAEEVFTFRMAACDNQVDRDHERFTDKALEGLAPLFVGKSVLSPGGKADRRALLGGEGKGGHTEVGVV